MPVSDEPVKSDAVDVWGSAKQDRVLWAVLGIALVLRLLPILIWPQAECIRDECIYRTMALKIVEGNGLTVSGKGWLASPGYPYLLAWMEMGFGSIHAVKWLQIVVGVATVGLAYGIGLVVSNLKVARIAAVLFALHPTLAWFNTTMWMETSYIFLLLASILAMLVARRRGPGAGAVCGVLLGLTVLFKGVATYLPPLFLLAAVWPEEGWTTFKALQTEIERRWRHAATFLIALVLTVAPYSIYASQRHGGFMVADATVGHVLFLGNNDFPPLTFDYGNGMLTGPLYSRYLRTGRRPCDRKRPPVQSSKCEVRQAVDWVKEHPDTFVGRIPMRVAQLLNPNTFLTRHVRWGYWPGFPWWAKEGLAVAIVLCSMGITLLGTATVWARAHGPFAFMAVGTVLYTLATTILMYGMTRFRLPLEALFIPYVAIFLAHPAATIDALKGSTWRAVGALLTLPALLMLMVWYLPTGFPMFW